MSIKVGDKVRWLGDECEAVLAVTSEHAFVVAIGESTVHRAPLPQLTLVESAPSPLSGLQAENAQLREALQAWVNDSPNEYRNQHDRMLYAKCLALGIRRKETP